jgi:M-phase phosphoprotein-6
MESSYSACENLSFGRMSFKGANPEIEKIMRRFTNPPPPKSTLMISFHVATLAPTLLMGSIV